LEKQVVCWPDEEEREQIKHQIEAESGFPSCLGFIDGTLIVLENKPLLDGEDYFSRKGRYGIAGLIICDHNKRIRYVYSGWAGCAHDARVFENSRLALHPEQFFTGNEYLLADSGYSPSQHIIPVFKKPPHSSLTAEETQFNFKLSSIRVQVEHCIGILKGHFQSLKGLRIMIRQEKDIKQSVYWIRACCVLHNLLLQDKIDNEWLEVERDEEDITHLEVNRQFLGEERDNGVKKRRDLMSIVLSNSK
jgi:hypothetical protein